MANLKIELEGNRQEIAAMLKEIAHRVAFEGYYYDRELERYLKGLPRLKEVKFTTDKIKDDE